MRGRQVLLALADQSTRFDVPAGDIPGDPIPDRARQMQILTATAVYVQNMRPRLPNFMAVRTTTQFEIATHQQLREEEASLQDTQLSGAKLGYHALGAAAQPNTELFFVATTEAPITYRDGKEVATVEPAAKKHAQLKPQSFVSSGEFGAILSTVDKDAFEGQISWLRWERSAHGMLAVFRYSVPQTGSHFAILSGASQLPGMAPSATYPGYHGEIAVDPADGSIYRILIIADLDPADPELLGALTLEYAPVDIGGKMYICPAHAVALSAVRDLAALPTERGPLRRYINDITFTQYHVFRSESRIIP
jgi:hypothetical protein